MEKKCLRRVEMSFVGCGFLAIYQIGVQKCIVDHAPHLLDEFQCYYGSSSGALLAVAAACKTDPMVAYKWLKTTYEASSKHRLLGVLHPSFDVYTRLRAFIEELLPKDAHRLSRDKVKISLTVFEGGWFKNILVSGFNTRKELINTLMATCFVPGYAGFKKLPRFRGRRCFDGGFTNNFPHSSDPNVVTVSPFSGECDICPLDESQTVRMVHFIDQKMHASSRNMIKFSRTLTPSSWLDLEENFVQGYTDTMRFFKTEGIVPITPMRPIYKNSTATQLAPRVTPTTADSVPEPISSPSANSDDGSDYFSDCGEEPNSCAHSQSAVSTNLYSCRDETEPPERHAPLSPFAMSLEEELEQIELEFLEEKMSTLGGGGFLQASWQRVTWLGQVITNLPLISGVCRAVGKGPR